MQKIDTQLDLAVKRIQNGESISSVLADVPEKSREELKAMLEIVALFSKLPLKEVPAPTKRRLYLQTEQHSSLWYSLGDFLRKWRIAPIALAVFALTTAATVFGAASSLPGDGLLFTLKKAAETARVDLASNQQERANLQLAFATQRVQEVQQVLSSPQSNSTQKQQAVQELNQQTSVALNELKQSSSVTPSVVNQAVNIAKAQQTIVAQVDPASAQQNVQQNKVALQAIQNLLATSNDETGTQLPPSNINTTGVISAISGDTITVGKNVFTIDNTIASITDKNGNELDFTNLEVSDTVTITGKVVGDQNLVDTITILDKMKVIDSTPASGQANPTAPAAPATKIIKIDLSNTSSTDTSGGASDQDQVTPIVPKPLDTYGGFIVEPPIDPSN